MNSQIQHYISQFHLKYIAPNGLMELNKITGSIEKRAYKKAAQENNLWNYETENSSIFRDPENSVPIYLKYHNFKSIKNSKDLPSICDEAKDCFSQLIALYHLRAPWVTRS